MVTVAMIAAGCCNHMLWGCSNAESHASPPQSMQMVHIVAPHAPCSLVMPTAPSASIYPATALAATLAACTRVVQLSLALL
jgi:hypothetical protein